LVENPFPEGAMDIAIIADLFIKVIPNLKTIDFSNVYGRGRGDICKERGMWSDVCDHMSEQRTARGRVGRVAFMSWD
jgi:hypothetical protein